MSPVTSMIDSSLHELLLSARRSDPETDQALIGWVQGVKDTLAADLTHSVGGGEAGDTAGKVGKHAQRADLHHDGDYNSKQTTCK